MLDLPKAAMVWVLDAITLSWRPIRKALLRVGMALRLVGLEEYRLTTEMESILGFPAGRQRAYVNHQGKRKRAPAADWWFSLYQWESIADGLMLVIVQVHNQPLRNPRIRFRGYIVELDRLKSVSEFALACADEPDPRLRIEVSLGRTPIVFSITTDLVRTYYTFKREANSLSVREMGYLSRSAAN